MRCSVFAVLTLVGCNQILGVSDPHLHDPNDASNAADARSDSAPVADGASCYGTGFVTECFTSPLVGTLTITPQTLNTDTSTLCEVQSMTACVVATGNLTVAAGTLSVIGTKPLVLIAGNTLTVTGILDVASHLTGQRGAGAVPVTDTTRCDLGVLSASSSGGGAGGSFGSLGGNGGGSTAGVRGAIKPAALRGGCAGQDNTPGANVKGMGGGAVYLIAGARIVVTGSINGSGAAGMTSTTSGGGGGGGSGGLIGLDAPAITNSGAIFANGGGGASASAGSSLPPGQNGNESVNGAAAPATGSIAGGGGGAARGVAAGAGVTAPIFTSGGGGGGGGVGIIGVVLPGSLSGSGIVSPSPS